MQEFVTYYVTNSGAVELRTAGIRQRRISTPPIQAAGYFLSLSLRLLRLPPPAWNIVPARTPMAKTPK